MLPELLPEGQQNLSQWYEDFCHIEAVRLSDRFVSAVSHLRLQELFRSVTMVLSVDCETLNVTANGTPPHATLPLGIDTPYPDRTLFKRNALQNLCLSVQYTAYAPQQDVLVQGIIFPQPGKRLNTAAIIRQAWVHLGLPLSDFRLRRITGGYPIVLLCGHWLGAEIGIMRNRRTLMAKPDVKSIGGGVVTLDAIAMAIKLDRSEHYGACTLHIRDTFNLLDVATKLEVLGQELGLEKIDLHPYTKDRMDHLLHHDKPLFIQYAMRDTEIPLLWIAHHTKNEQEIFKLRRGIIQPTIGATSVAGLKEFYPDYKQRFGIDRDKRTGKWKPDDARHEFENFPTQCFYGGMNQSYTLGFVEGEIADFDITAAYTRTYGVIPAINWDVPPLTSERDPWKLTSLTDFARISFAFPPGTLFPCLPLHTLHGLIYLLSCTKTAQSKRNEGHAYVTGPELHEALLMGADVTVHSSMQFAPRGLLLPEYARMLVRLRKHYPETDSRNTYAKLALNALYGKTGQGLTDYYTNDQLFSEVEIDEGKTPPYCAITLPHTAAMITGIVRAALNVLVRTAHAMGGQVLSATTDGLMVRFPAGTDCAHMRMLLEERASTSPSVQLLLQGGHVVELDQPLLKEKYHGNQAWTARTRMNWIGQDGVTVHEARTGLKREPGEDGYVSTHTLMELTKTRQHRIYRHTRLNKIADITSKQPLGRDITHYYQEMDVNLTPDWKRDFAPDGSSTPFTSLEAYWHNRAIVDRLKVDAWPDVVHYHVHHTSTKPRATTAATVHRREIAHRIALDHEGYRVPPDLSLLQVALKLGLGKNALYKLKKQRFIDTGWNENTPEVDAIKSDLGLW